MTLAREELGQDGYQKKITDVVKYDCMSSDTGWWSLFCEVYSNTGSIDEACSITGISNKTVHNIKRNDDLFAKMMQMAKSRVIGKLERTAMMLATEGENKHTFHQGDLVHTEKVINTKMLQLLLQAHDKEKYSNQIAVSSQHDQVGDDAQFDYSQLSKEDLEALHKIANKAKKENNSVVVEAEVVGESA